LSPASPPVLKRDPAGLVPAIVQQHDTGEVLMLAWMNDEALELTLTSGRATYFSRSRGNLWVKGETSAASLSTSSPSPWTVTASATVGPGLDQVGAACHTGERTCFHNPLGEGK